MSESTESSGGEPTVPEVMAAGPPAAGPGDPQAATPESGSQPSLTRATLGLLWRAAARHPVLLAISLVAPIATMLVARFVGPWFIAALLSDIQSGSVTLADSAWLIAGYALSQFMGQVVGWRIALYTTWTFQVRSMRWLFQRVFDHLTSQGMAFHANRFSGALVSQANKLTGAFEMFWDTIVWQVIPVGTTVVAAVAILAFILPWYAVFLAVMSIAFAGFVVASARTMERLNVAEAGSANRMTGFLADVMTNISAVKSAGAEAAESRTAGRMAQDWADRSLAVMRSFLGYSTGFSAVIAITNTGAVVAAVLAAQEGAVSVAAVYLAITYTLTVTDQLWEITQVMRNYNKVLGDAHDMVAILGMAPVIADLGDLELPRGPGHVEFDHVRFSHEAGADDALFEDFTLDIAAGEKIGLVGPSGSGKTTLVRLLLRFADVDAGSIRIDGLDLRAVTQSSLRRNIAYVAQEPLLFHRSVAENISYGRPDATAEQVRQAAEQASAAQFVQSLPAGFETLVGERGVKLSGGQRQRIAIARAVLVDASVLVLDEATSALDSESEVHIQAALAQAMAGRTTIVIAHRLSTVQAMDRIVVLDEGRIVEQGAPGELLSAGGMYASLWAHQSGGFLT